MAKLKAIKNTEAEITLVDHGGGIIVLELDGLGFAFFRDGVLQLIPFSGYDVAQLEHYLECEQNHTGQYYIKVRY